MKDVFIINCCLTGSYLNLITIRLEIQNNFIKFFKSENEFNPIEFQNVQRYINKIGHEIDCFDVGGSIVQAISTVGRVDEILSNCDTRKGGSPDGL